MKPLSRIELGEKQVQGLDYAYTLQGWIKALNGYQTNPDYDIGLDGNPKTLIPNSRFAADAFNYTLQYYNMPPVTMPIDNTRVALPNINN